MDILNERYILQKLSKCIVFLSTDSQQVKDLRESYKTATEYLLNCKLISRVSLVELMDYYSQTRSGDLFIYEVHLACREQAQNRRLLLAGSFLCFATPTHDSKVSLLAGYL